jgi:uncharacterized membrane protein
MIFMMSFINACRVFGFGRFGGRFDQGDGFSRLGPMHPGFMLIGLLIAILVIVGAVFLARALIRSSRKGHSSDHLAGQSDAVSPVVPVSPNPGKALQILDERLASGEIDTDEYRRRKDELLRP